MAKYDGDKTYDAANLPQGSASLALSHWQLNYYSDYHSTTDTTWTQSATPVRSWVMQTNENGFVDLRFGESTFTTKDGVVHPYKVSGDDFYHASDGMITLPLGAVTLQEIKAPAGYLLPDPNPIYASQITSDGVLELVDTYNMPITPEPVKRGDIAIMKFGEQTPDPEGQPSTKTLTIKSGTVTSVINPHLNQELRHYEGVTDADGRINVSKILRGSYILTEAKTLPGYVRDKTAYPFVVDENGLIDGAAAKTFEFANDVTKVHVFKRASEGAELADAKLQIRDAHDALVEEWVSDGKAHLIQALPVGDYTLVELAAPQGYKVADPVKFTVTETATIQEVVMVDEVAPALPTTGDKTLTLLLIGLGIAGVLAGGAGTAIAVRKMHKDSAASQNKE